LDDYVWFVFWVLGGDGFLVGWDYDRVTLFDSVGNELWVKFLRGSTPSPSISPNGEFLAGFEEAMLYLYSLESGEEEHRVRAPGQSIYSVSWVNDGEYLVVGQASGYVTLYKLAGNMVEEVWTKRVIEEIMAESTSPFPQPSGKILLNGTSPHIYLVNLKGDIIWKRSLDSMARSAAFSPKEDYTAVITKYSLYIINLEDGEEVAHLRVNPAPSSIVWTENYIIIGDERGYVNTYYWDNGKVTPATRFKTVEEDIALKHGLSYNSKQHWLAVASTNRWRVHVYDIKSP